MLDVEAAISDQRDAHPDDVGDLLARAGAQVGTDVTLYLVDFGQVVLQPVPSFSDPQVVPEENVATSLERSVRRRTKNGGPWMGTR